MDKQTMKSYIAALLLANSLFLFGACTEKKSYKDTSLPPAERAELLLKEMTLEEENRADVSICRTFSCGS